MLSHVAVFKRRSKALVVLQNASVYHNLDKDTSIHIGHCPCPLSAQVRDFIPTSNIASESLFDCFHGGSADDIVDESSVVLGQLIGFAPFDPRLGIS
jgi:hypothetical protein